MSQQKAAELIARSLSSLAKYAVVFGVGGSALAASMYNVVGGERAVLFDRFRGVLPDASGEGTHFLVPWVQTAHMMDIRVRPRLIPSATGTKDLQMVSGRSICSTAAHQKKKERKGVLESEHEQEQHPRFGENALLLLLFFLIVFFPNDVFSFASLRSG